MKKLLVLCLTVLLACPLFANEAAVRNVLLEVNEASGNLQLRKMLTHYDRNFTEISADGQKIDYAQAEIMIKAMDMLDDPNAKLSDFFEILAPFVKEITPQGIKAFKVIENPNAKLSEIMVAASQMSGNNIAPEELEQYKALDDTPKGKELAKQIQAKFGDLKAGVKAKMKAEMKAKAKAEAASFKIVSVKVDGNNAVAVCTNVDAETKRNQQSTVTLIKKDGKWLIVKNVSKYI